MVFLYFSRIFFGMVVVFYLGLVVVVFVRVSFWWIYVEMEFLDFILEVIEIFKRDINSKKRNLGVGVCGDDNGKLYVFFSVRKVGV